MHPFGFIVTFVTTLFEQYYVTDNNSVQLLPQNEYTCPVVRIQIALGNLDLENIKFTEDLTQTMIIHCRTLCSIRL